MTLEQILDRHLCRQLDLFKEMVRMEEEVAMINRFTDSNR